MWQILTSRLKTMIIWHYNYTMELWTSAPPPLPVSSYNFKPLLLPASTLLPNFRTFSVSKASLVP